MTLEHLAWTATLPDGGSSLLPADAVSQTFIALGRSMRNIPGTLNRGAARDFLEDLKFEEGHYVRRDAFQAGPAAVVDRYVTDLRHPRRFWFPDEATDHRLSAADATALNTEVGRRLERLDLKRQLTDAAQGLVAPVSLDSMWKAVAFPLAESVPSMVLSASPAGLAALAEVYTTTAREDLMADGFTREQSATLAPFIGAAQAAADRLGLAWLQKTPGAALLFEKWASASLLTRGVVRLGATTVAETAVDLTQGTLIRAVAQDVYSWLNANVPGTDWDSVRAELERAAPQTLFSMLLLSAAGTGLAQARDIRGLATLARGEPEALRLLGFSPAHIAAITLADDADAVTVLKNLWPERSPFLQEDHKGHSPGEAASFVSGIIKRARQAITDAGETADTSSVASAQEGTAETAAAVTSPATAASPDGTTPGSGETVAAPDAPASNAAADLAATAPDGVGTAGSRGAATGEPATGNRSPQPAPASSVEVTATTPGQSAPASRDPVVRTAAENAGAPQAGRPDADRTAPAADPAGSPHNGIVEASATDGPSTRQDVSPSESHSGTGSVSESSATAHPQPDTRTAPGTAPALPVSESRTSRSGGGSGLSSASASAAATGIRISRGSGHWQLELPDGSVLHTATAETAVQIRDLLGSAGAASRPARPSSPRRPLGANNTLFTREALDNLRQRLHEHQGHLYSGGFDPETLKILFQLGGYLLETGTRKFADWAEAMRSEFHRSMQLGTLKQPKLREYYEQLRFHPRADQWRLDMTPAETLEKSAKRMDAPASWEDIRQGHNWDKAKKFLPKNTGSLVSHQIHGTWAQKVQGIAVWLTDIDQNSPIVDPWGRRILLANPDAGGGFSDRIWNRAAHIIGQDTGGPARIEDPQKLLWVKTIPETINGAGVRVRHGQKVLYFRSYAESTHVVITENIPRTQDYALTTQYPVGPKPPALDKAWIEQVRHTPPDFTGLDE